MSLLKTVFAGIGVFATSAAIWEGGKWVWKEIQRDMDTLTQEEMQRRAAAVSSSATAEIPSGAHDIEEFNPLFEVLWANADPFSEMSMAALRRENSHHEVPQQEIAKLLENERHALLKAQLDSGNRVVAGGMSSGIFFTLIQDPNQTMLWVGYVTPTGRRGEWKRGVVLNDDAYNDAVFTIAMLWELREMVGDFPTPLINA